MSTIVSKRGSKPGISDSHRASAEGSDVNALRALHDQLLAEKPEGAVHDEETCDLCRASDDPEGGSMGTFSEEELQAAIDAAVAEATAPLQSRIAELEAAKKQEAENSAQAELEAKITELESKLDAAVLEATQAKEEKDALQQAWDDEKAAAAEAEQVAARRDERLSQVKELACFPDEYIEENGDRFAAMSDEDWNARLEEWKTVVKPKETASSGVPAKTALTAARQSNEGDGSSLGLLREFRHSAVDPRTL